VVLSPRPVSFKAAPYGKKVPQLLDAIDKASAHEKDYKRFPTGLRRLVSTVTERTLNESSWMDRLEPKDRVWFYPDPDFADLSVREDTNLYMRVSVCRLVRFLDTHNVGSGRYEVYWDKNSVEKITVGMRHAFHVPDFTYDFDAEQLSAYDTLIASNIADDGNVKHALSDNLRKQITQLCEDYVQKTTALLGLGADPLLGNLEDLIVSNLHAGIAAEIYVGGPFTEALAYWKHAPVERIVGMGGFIEGLDNLFPNQFNFLVDMESATAILDLAGSGEVRLTLLPTECVKNAVYTLSHEELEECLSESPASWKLFRQYHRDANPLTATYTPFDWVVALTIHHPDLFTKKTVKKDTKKESDGTEVIIFLEKPETNIVMYWNDKEHMESRRSEYISALKDTFKESTF
jgi:hypothetical protein